MPQSYLVCRDDELKDGDRRVVSCDGTEVGVFRSTASLSPGTTNARIGLVPCVRAASTSASSTDRQ